MTELHEIRSLDTIKKREIKQHHTFEEEIKDEIRGRYNILSEDIADLEMRLEALDGLYYISDIEEIPRK